METIVTLLSGLVIICLLGAMLYATKAIKARRKGNDEEKQKNLKMAGVFFFGYLAVNMIRLWAESNLI
jgi:membrane-anchored protein YejM (alkaline phosphatase superfamily)